MKTVLPVVWAIAASVLLIVGTYSLWGGNYASVVSTENIAWRHGTHYEIGQPLSRDWVDIESGILQLAYSSTAVMKIDAPARFRVTGDRDCEVQLGSVMVHAPAKAKGFTVTTPEMQVVDLGTSFRVDVEESGQTTLQVLEGVVEAQAESDGQKYRLVSGNLATSAGANQPGLQIALEESFIPTTSKRIAFRAKHMPSLGQHGFKGNDRCYVFMERHDFKLPQDLPVNIMDVGKHAQFADLAGEIAAGTRVDCFLLHSAPRGKRHLVEGTVTFVGEILGVISSSDKLNATNSNFGSPWTLRCQHPERGFEGTPNKNSDRLEISDDRRTLRVSVRTESIDQLRILVRSVPQEQS